MATWARAWQIVKSQDDFEHVILENRALTFVPAEQDGELGYRIAHNGTCCFKGSCKETFLRVENGTGTIPDLATIAGNVPKFQKDFSNTSMLKTIDNYFNEYGASLVRLVGDIELPEHARPSGEDRKLEFYVYQINNAVEDDRTMVFFQAKLNPNDAASGGGSVAGYS